MRNLLILLFVLIGFAGNVGAQSSSARFEKLDEWMADNVKDMGGRAILVVYKDGKVEYLRSVNDMSRRQKMVNKYIAKRQGKEANLDDYSISSRQPIASCSKWLSAALVMTFVDEGKLQLSDTVGKYLPELSLHGKGGITVRQCLSHLTGIKEPPLKETLRDWKGLNSMDQAIASIGQMPMEGEPGTVFHYSNAGLQIAGAVIEKISGKSFETLFAERIARPLNMKNTDFGHGPVAMPAGGASSTPEDYMHFLVMILDKGVYNGTRVLSEKSVVEMEVNRLGPDVKIGYSPAAMGGDPAGKGDGDLAGEVGGVKASDGKSASGGDGMKAGDGAVSDFVSGRRLGYGYGEWVMGAGSAVVSSPGLFGSFPWVDKKKGYCAFLMTFNVNSNGRSERYASLLRLVDAGM